MKEGVNPNFTESLLYDYFVKFKKEISYKCLIHVKWACTSVVHQI